MKHGLGQISCQLSVISYQLSVDVLASERWAPRIHSNPNFFLGLVGVVLRRTRSNATCIPNRTGYL